MVCFPYETSSATAALQNDFKKRYKRAVKGPAAAVANFGCFALQRKASINSAFAAAQKIPESRSAPCTKWLQSAFEKTKNIVTRDGLPLVSTKKRNADFNNTIIMIHGRGVDKALLAE